MIPQNLNLNVRFLIMLFFWTFEIFAIMHETALSRPNGTGKFPEFLLRVRRDPNDEIDLKRKIFSTIQFFDMISQSLNLSLFATYKLIKRPLPSKRRDTGKFSKFFLRVRGDLSNEIDCKRKICSTIQFFDMISQSVNLSLFAICKLIKRPLPSKRHGEISWFFPQG